MPEPINKLILQNYSTYKRVRFEKKVIESETIILAAKKSNINFKLGTSFVRSSVISDLELIIEADRINVKSYGFKLKAASISEKPFFRFDAAGCTHNNHSPLTPLPLRQIKTPHFQYYDELGYNTAYQTESLKDPKIITELETDINKGIGLFCEESVIFTVLNGYPNIDREPGLIFKTEEIDPLINVKFDEP